LSKKSKLKPIGYAIAQFSIARRYIQHHASGSVE